MLNRWHTMILVSLALGLPGTTLAEPPSGVAASLSSASRYIQPGQPIWVDFSLTNLTNEPIELSVEGLKPLPSSGLMGLPQGHVFSGHAFAGLSVKGTSLGRVWDVPTGYNPPTSAEVIVLGPHSTVGVGLDVSQFYPVLRSPGEFSLSWSPYGGAVTSNELVIEVAHPKQALIQTDVGNLTVQFFYGDAPAHVANFLELSRSGFYDNLKFHRIVPGYFIQGGCPQGTGQGLRPDGKKLDAELSAQPIRRGSFCMARLEEDLNSASSQFFISSARIAQWDGRYTVFGELVGEESMTTLDRLLAEPASAEGVPIEPVYMRAIRITDAPRPAVSFPD